MLREERNLPIDIGAVAYNDLNIVIDRDSD